jgi:hypothetical protein
MALCTSGYPLTNSVRASGCEWRIAVTTVKPSPGFGMCRSVMSTSKLCVVISLRASVTLATATTLNPFDSRVAVIISRTASSSSTSRTLWAAGGSVGVIQHRLSSRTNGSVTRVYVQKCIKVNRY